MRDRPIHQDEGSRLSRSAGRLWQHNWWTGAVCGEDGRAALVQVLRRRETVGWGWGWAGSMRWDLNVFWTDSFVTLCHRGTSCQETACACTRESERAWLAIWQCVMSLHVHSITAMIARPGIHFVNKNHTRTHMMQNVCCGIQNIWPQCVFLHYLWPTFPTLVFQSLSLWGDEIWKFWRTPFLRRIFFLVVLLSTDQDDTKTASWCVPKGSGTYS